MDDSDIYRNCGCELSGICDVCCARVPRSIGFLEGLSKVKTNNTLLRPIQKNPVDVNVMKSYIKKLLAEKGFPIK